MKKNQLHRLLAFICAIVLTLSPLSTLSEGLEEDTAPVIVPEETTDAGSNGIFGILISHSAAQQEESGLRLDMDIDFSAFDPEGEEALSLVSYDTVNARVLVDLAALLSGQQLGAVQADIAYEEEEETEELSAEQAAAKEIDVTKLSMEEDAAGDVRFEAGNLLLTGDGSVRLTDGEDSLQITVRGYDALLAHQMTADGVTIEVLSGFVPAGSAPAFAALGEEQAEALIAQYLTEAPAEELPVLQPMALKKNAAALQTLAVEAVPAPRTGEATGSAAFSLSIETGEDAPLQEGAYRVTLPLSVDPEALVPADASLTGVSYRLYHIHEEQPREITDFSLENGLLTFTTDQFSDFILRYTVDFTYVDEAGAEHTYNLNGGENISLIALLNELGILADMQLTADDLIGCAAAFSADMPEGLVELAPIYAEDGETVIDWTLTSLAPFSTQHTLTVTLADGRKIVIGVTDETDWQDFNSNNNIFRWRVDAEGTLTIKGNGSIGGANLQANAYPWNAAGVATTVKKVVIGEGVTSLGQYCFKECKNTETVDFSNATALKTIYTGIFENVSSITSIDFSGCTELETIYNHAFGSGKAEYSGVSITSLDLSNCTKLKTIMKYAFGYCRQLKDITLAPSIETIGERTFIYNESLETVDLTALKNLKTIGKNAFDHCTSLTEVDFSGLESLQLDVGVFEYCSALKRVNLSGDTGLDGIKEYTFNGCGDLEFLDLSGCTGITEFKSQAFRNCKKLKFNLEDMTGLTSIGSYAFSYCYGLDEIDLTQFPNLSTIGDHAFDHCDNATKIDMHGLVNLTAIPPQAFEWCIGVTEIDLAGLSNVTSIGEFAFGNLKNPGLRSIDLTDMTNLHTIGKSAFILAGGGDAVIDLSNCNEITSIGESAFQSIGRYNGNNKSKTGTVNEVGGIILPSLKNVQSIGANAFNTSTLDLTSTNEVLDFSGNTVLNTIGKSAFFNCTDIVTLDLSDCTALTSIGESAFSQDGNNGRFASITSVNLKNAGTVNDGYIISKNAFNKQSKLTSVDMNNSKVTQIGESAFADCTALVSMDLKTCDSLTTIGANAFKNCTGLDAITIPKGVTSIDGSAFSGCSGFQSITWDAENYPSSIAESLFPSSGYDLTVGGDVSSLPQNFFNALRAAEDIFFEGIPGGHVIHMDATVTAGARSPLSAIQNDCYVDSQGVVYELIGGTAQVAYCPPGIVSYTVPSSITANGTQYSVTAVAPSAFTLARNLQSITFENPAQVDVGNNAFLGLNQLDTVIGPSGDKHTIVTAMRLFKTAQASAFQRTGLEDDLDHYWSAGAEGTEINIGNVEVQANSDPGLRIYSSSGNHLLTGQNYNCIIQPKQSTTASTKYRVYFAFSDDQHASLLSSYSMGSKSVQCKNLGDNIYCIEFELDTSDTAQPITIPLSYPQPQASTPGTAGGYVHIWGQIVKDGDGEDIYSLKGTDEKYILVDWTTKKADVSLTKNAESSVVNIKGSGTQESTLYPIDGQLWRIALSFEQSVYGKEYVRQVHYSDQMQLPVGVTWAPEFLSAIASGAYSLAYSKANSNYQEYRVVVNGKEYLYMQFPNSTTGNRDSIRLTTDGTNLTVSWDLKNPNYKTQEFTTQPVYLGALNGALIMNLADVWVDGNKNVVARDTAGARAATEQDFPLIFPISNNAEVQLTYAFGGVSDAMSYTAGTNAVAGKANLTLDKTRTEQGNATLGSPTSFTLTAENTGAGGTNQVYTLSDPLEDMLYITPADLETMFRGPYGTRLCVTVKNADWYNWTEQPASPTVMDTQGGSMTLTEYNSGKLVSAWQGEMQITWDGSQYTVTGNGATQSGASLAALLGGYRVDADDQYTVQWTFTKDTDPFFFAGGMVIQLPVYATHKTATQLLVGSNKKTVGTVNLSNQTTLTYKEDGIEKRLTDACLPWSVSGDLTIDKTTGAKKDISTTDYANYGNNQVVPYTVKLGNGSSSPRTDVPVFDTMTGKQLLLAETATNSLSGLKTVTADGKTWYVLTPGTYSHVKLGDWFADSVIVTQNGSDYTTEIKWYVPTVPAGGNVSNTYTAMALAHDPATGEPYISYTYNNTVRINAPLAGDKAPAKGQGGGGASYEVDKKIITAQGATPAQDQVDSDGYTWLKADARTALYRLDVVFRPLDASWSTSVRWSDLVDELPRTFGSEQWTLGNGGPFTVNMKAVETTGNVTIKNASGDSVQDSQLLSSAEIVDGNKIKWTKDDAGDNIITMQGTSLLSIYMELTYASAADWSAYCTEINGDYIANTFKGGAKQAAVYHDLKENMNQALLQKGVNYVYSISATDSRTEYSNIKGAVEYYALLYNGGHTRMYVDRLVDELPAGFTFWQVGAGQQAGQQIYNSETPSYSLTRKGEYSVTPNGIRIVAANISASGGTRDGEPLIFTISGGTAANDSSTTDIHYDKYLKRYYLKPGEAIAFSYVAKVSETMTATKDLSLNTIRLTANDPAGLGVEPYVFAEGVSAPTGVTRAGIALNDGDCTALSGNTGLQSNVALTRGAIIPGIAKEMTKYQTTTGSWNPVVGSSRTFTDAKGFVWTITLKNDGTSQINNYTVEDVMQLPFGFSGDVNYIIEKDNNPIDQAYDTSGNPSTNGKLFDVTVNDKDTQVTVKALNGDSISIPWGGSAQIPLPKTMNNANQQNLTVGFKKTGGECRMSITFPEDTLPIPTGAQGKLVLSTTANSIQANSYTNIAILRPEQSFVSVLEGQRVENGLAIQSRSEFSITAPGMTTANISVTQNDATASSDGAVSRIVLDDPAGYFTYTMQVQNTLNDSNTPKKMVLLINLPETGDTYPFRTGANRGSEFKVSFADVLGLQVTQTAGNNVQTLTENTDYTVEYSSKTTFDTTSMQDSWTGEPSGEKRALRITLNKELAPNAVISVSFNAKVNSPENLALPGETAYANFAYGYTLDDSSAQNPTWYYATPRAVGVSMPKLPTLQKQIVNLNGVEQTADADKTFYFLIYPTGEGAPTDAQITSIKEALASDSTPTAMSSNWLLKSVTVDQGQAHSEDEASVNVLQLDQSGFWKNDQTYAIRELDIDARYRIKNWQLTRNGVKQPVSADPVYIFKYENDASQHILANNADQQWSIQLTKQDQETNALISGAKFALYTKADDHDNDAATISYEGITWSEKAEGTTNNNGQITWQNLTADEYLYKEITPATGYYAAAADAYYRVSKSDTSAASTVARVTVQNEQAWLTITKQVTGERTDPDLDFFFKLTQDGAASGTAYPYEKGESTGTITDGQENAFTLKHDETIRVYVPVGKDYTLTETISQGTPYMVQVGPSSGVDVLSSMVETTSHYGNALTFTVLANDAAHAPHVTVLNDRPICKIVVNETINGQLTAVEHPFRTLRDAMAFINSSSNSTAAYVGGHPVIEMLVDYTMPANDTLIIPAGKTVTLTTAKTTGSEVYLFESIRPSATTAIITRGFDEESMINNSGSLTLANITLDGDKEQHHSTAKGGIVQMNNGSLTVSEQATLQNSHAASGDGGGAIYMLNGMLRMDGLIQNCSTTGNGGGIFAGNGQVTITGTITGCNAVGIASSAENDDTNGNGGAIKTTHAKITLESSAQLTNNTALKKGGAIYASDSLVMEGGIISGNTALSQGGGIYLDGNASMTMSSGQITNNTAANDNGGGIQSKGTELIISGGSITGNKAKKGGGVSVERGTMNMSGTALIANNEADQQGGGVYVTGDSTIATISAGNIRENHAKSGGGIYQNKGTLTIKGNSSITNNEATQHGGGIYHNAGTLDLLENGSISNNTASQNGGGIYAAQGTAPTLTGGEIKANTATKNGGGIYYAGGASGSSVSVTLGGTAITGNSAYQDGGGVYAEKNTAITMSFGSLQNNSATRNGGGVYLGGSVTLTATDGTIENNSAISQGGGAYVGSQAVLTLRGADVQNNKSAAGAGVYIAGNGTMNMSAGQITGNTASQANGGAVNVENGTSCINFSGDPTIYNNLSGGTQKNVVLSVDSNDVIRVTGEMDTPEENDKIGVYVPDGNTLYNAHGGALDPFGAYGESLSTDPLYRFYNDRNGLRGGGRTTDHRVVWIQMAQLTVKKTIAGETTPSGKTFSYTLNVLGNYDYAWSNDGTNSSHGVFTTGLQTAFGQSSTTFTLGNGNEAVFNNLPAGLSIELTETGADGYILSVLQSENKKIASHETNDFVVTFRMTDDADSNANKAVLSIENRVSFIPPAPTGFTQGFAPYAGMLIAGILLVLLALRKRKEELSHPSA